MAKIAIDIDSTLHHYWDLLQRVARERYGVELPYEEQRDWGITALERDALVHCVEETHSDENVEAAVPYPGAVETVRAWHDAGHWIHVTSRPRARTRHPGGDDPPSLERAGRQRGRRDRGPRLARATREAGAVPRGLSGV